MCYNGHVDMANIEDHLDGRLCEAVALLRGALGPALRSVVLFGSHARGCARADSDVDLLVVVDGASDGARALRSGVRGALRREVDIYVFGQDDLRENFRVVAPVLSTLVLGIRVLYDPDAVFRRLFRSFLPKLARSRRRYLEGTVTWELHALARDLAASHASSLEPLLTTLP